MNNKIIDHLESWNVKDSVLLVSIASVKNSADYADSIRSFSESLSEKLSLPLFRVSEVSKLDRIFASEINWAKLDAVWESDVLNETSISNYFRLLLEMDYLSTRKFNDNLRTALRGKVDPNSIYGLNAKLLRVAHVLGCDEIRSVPRANHALLLTTKNMMDSMDLTYENSRLKDDFLLTRLLCVKYGIPFKMIYLEDLN